MRLGAGAARAGTGLMSFTPGRRKTIIQGTNPHFLLENPDLYIYNAPRSVEAVGIRRRRRRALATADVLLQEIVDDDPRGLWAGTERHFAEPGCGLHHSCVPLRYRDPGVGVGRVGDDATLGRRRDEHRDLVDAGVLAVVNGGLAQRHPAL